MGTGPSPTEQAAIPDCALIVEYSSSVWSPNTDKYIGKIEMVKRTAAKWTLDNFHTQASVTEMLTQLGWRSLEQRRNDSRLCLFYKIIHGLVAIDLPPYVEHQARTSRKNSHPLIYRKIHTGAGADYYKYSFYPLTIVQWNRKLHYCPLLNPSRGQYVQLATQCHKCQCVVFIF